MRKRLLTGDDLGDRNATAARAATAVGSVRQGDGQPFGRLHPGREHSAPQAAWSSAPCPGFAIGPFMGDFGTYVAPGLEITAPNGLATLNTLFPRTALRRRRGIGPTSTIWICGAVRRPSPRDLGEVIS
ncbi:hypothetical protein ACRAWD_30030 [Caulobacter segnis]